MTSNEDKMVRKHQQISPDLDRLKPLMDMPVPSILKELKRLRELFTHYSKWILNFSTKLHNFFNICLNFMIFCKMGKNWIKSCPAKKKMLKINKWASYG